MILFLNGAFGIGKTTVARTLARRLPRCVVYDPELLGIILQRLTRVSDFQDLRLWRRLTILGIRLTSFFVPHVIVPMAFSNPAYLSEIRSGVARSAGRQTLHVCLIAPLDVVRERLGRRGDAGAWEYRRAEECCVAHASEEFAVHVDATRDVDAIVDSIVAMSLKRPNTRPTISA